MKPMILSFLTLLTTTLSWGQLSGDIVVDKRTVTNQISYTMEASHEGVMVFDIAVNTAGKVTSCVLNKTQSNVHSTRQMVKAKNLILTELTFERDNGAPTFHQGQVKITCLSK